MTKSKLGRAGKEKAERGRARARPRATSASSGDGKGATRVPPHTRPWNPGPKYSRGEREEERSSFQIARPPVPSPKLEGKYLLRLRPRYKLILNNTDALFFCSVQTATL